MVSPSQQLVNITPTESPPTSKGNTWDLANAIVHFNLPSKASEMVSHSFLFNEKRLTKLCLIILDLINIESVCPITATWTGKTSYKILVILY